MDDAIESVLATGTLPEMEFETGVPVPVAFWRGEQTGIVLFFVRHRDGGYHYLASSGGPGPDWASHGGVVGGGAADELPERTEPALVEAGIEIWGQVGFGDAHAVWGLAAAGIDEVTLDSPYVDATVAVHPRTGAFLVGTEGAVYPVCVRVTPSNCPDMLNAWPQAAFGDPVRAIAFDRGALGATMELTDVPARPRASVHHVVMRVAREARDDEPEAEGYHPGVLPEWFAWIDHGYVGTGPAQGSESWTLDRDVDDWSDAELVGEMRRIIHDGRGPERWARLHDALRQQGFELTDEELDAAPMEIVVDSESRPVLTI